MDAAAYCTERRAFLIVDAPSSAVKPDDMEKLISGTTLPKSENAAIFYPGSDRESARFRQSAEHSTSGTSRDCSPAPTRSRCLEGGRRASRRR